MLKFRLRLRQTITSAGLALVLGCAGLSVFGLLPGPAIAASGLLLPNGEQTFLDVNGDPLGGGSVSFYIPSTLTPKNTWSNKAQTTLNTNPVGLDAAGRAIIYGTGSYRQIVKDAFGNTIWDQLTYGTPDPSTVKPTIRLFATPGTTSYTPTSGMTSVLVECVGGGGGGGGGNNTGAANGSGGGGGGGGSYARVSLSASQVGSSQSVTVGTGGIAGAGTPTAGSAGGASSFGAFCTSSGGGGGAAGVLGSFVLGGAGGSAGVGDFKTAGADGGTGIGNNVSTDCPSPTNNGGDSMLGQGGKNPGVAAPGNPGKAYGGGGAGGSSCNSLANQGGGAGANGAVLITEYFY